MTTVTNPKTDRPTLPPEKSEGKSVRRDRVLGVTMIAAGLAIAAVSYMQSGNAKHMLAQAPQSPASDSAKPATDPTEGQSRPTTPAPEPARPQPIPDATPNSPGTTGTSPSNAAPPAALPPAPAEKVGEPIKPREAK